MEKLKLLRKSKNMTLRELADVLDMNFATLSHYELGRRQADYDTLIKISDYFDVSLDYLLGHKKNNGTGEIVPCYTADEKEIIDDYRTLSHDSCLLLKGYLKALVRMSSSNSSQSKETIMKIDS